VTDEALPFKLERNRRSSMPLLVSPADLWSEQAVQDGRVQRRRDCNMIGARSADFALARELTNGCESATVLEAGWVGPIIVNPISGCR